ncbi:14001_t:CDS:2 [Acaulospora colombiana]|uniref:14001_t:CDS:1 n=1 Tax=Acaulospora colombiana TaxID=27376 RepID=A0ACA9JYX5_9GLOM|nr:14001_t:CDS:2 [Acaulospora colombiana]
MSWNDVNEVTLIPSSSKSRANPNASGSHRKSLVESLDQSLKRLNVGYVDILYVHFWEFRTPIEEVMRALDDTVRSGKALYVAISDAPSWVMSRANTMADFYGWRFLTGKYTKESVEKKVKSGARISDRVTINEWTGVEKNWEILEEVKKISKEINKSPVQVALNWIAQKPGITSPLIGARTKAQLDENIKALEFK